MVYKVVLIKVTNRDNNATEVQRILTENGCIIRVRLGLHDLPSDSCSPEGLILLEVSASDNEVDAMVDLLNKLSGISAKLVTI